MKTMGKSLLIGLAVALLGLVFAEGFGTVVNGLEPNASRLIGMGAYLCVVIVVCTGFLAGHIAKNK